MSGDEAPLALDEQTQALIADLIEALVEAALAQLHDIQKVVVNEEEKILSVDAAAAAT